MPQCGRPTKTGDPCKAKPIRFHTACELHATEDERVQIELLNSIYWTGWREGRKSAEHSQKERIQFLEDRLRGLRELQVVICPECLREIPLRDDGTMQRHRRQKEQSGGGYCKQRKRVSLTCPDHPIFLLTSDGVCPIDDEEIDGNFTTAQREVIQWLFGETEN